MEVAIQPPPPGTDIYASLQPSIYAATFITWGLAIIAVILRFLARRISNAKLWWDDWLMVVALAMMLRHGLGRHIWAIHPTPDDLESLFLGLFILQISYIIEIVLVKCSILLFYWRIFRVSSIKWPIYILFTTIVVWGVASIIVICLQCIPTAGIWNKSLHASCNINPHEFYMGYIIPNIVVDLILLALPMPYVWKLKISTQKKFAISGVFLLGGFVAAVSIVRFVFFMKSNVTAPDIFWNLAPSDIWSIVELNMALVSGCLPSMGPFLKIGTQSSSKESGSSGSFGSRARMLAARFAGGTWFSSRSDSKYTSTQNSTPMDGRRGGPSFEKTSTSNDSDRKYLTKFHDLSSSDEDRSSQYALPNLHVDHPVSSRILVRDDIDVTSAPIRMV